MSSGFISTVALLFLLSSVEAALSRNEFNWDDNDAALFRERMSDGLLEEDPDDEPTRDNEDLLEDMQDKKAIEKRQEVEEIPEGLPATVKPYKSANEPLIQETATRNDIMDLTRNTKTTIIASLCSLVIVSVILGAALCYVRFSSVLPSRFMEKAKGTFATMCGGHKLSTGGSPVAQADAERAEEESEDDENDDADFTVYECEGPALAGSDMELRNPMFHSATGEPSPQPQQQP